MENTHNALGGNSADQLRAYVRRIEVIEEEIVALNSDKSEIYAEVKAVGFCKKTLRKVVVRRRRERADLEEEDTILDLYEQIIANTTVIDSLDN